MVLRIQARHFFQCLHFGTMKKSSFFGSFLELLWSIPCTMLANPQGGKERPSPGGKEETATTNLPTAVNGDNATRGGAGDVSGGNIAGGAPRTLWTGDANSLDSTNQGNKKLGKKRRVKNCELFCCFYPFLLVVL
jgi:hypothetical protein